MDDDEESAECPACDGEGEGELLGVLGDRAHYRCFYCGAEFNVPDPKEGKWWKYLNRFSGSTS